MAKQPPKPDSAEPEPKAAPPTDIFQDIEKLRIPQDFAEALGVRQVLTTVPIRRPGKQEFIRVRPEPEYRFSIMVLDDERDNDTYLVAPALRSALFDELKPVTLFTTINRDGIITLWPVRLPGTDGKNNPWWRSALEAARLAEAKWVRVRANMGRGAYDVEVADDALNEPQWPDTSFTDLLRIAFKDFTIENLDHPVLKRLRGAL